jgi:hypothetical protein
VVAEGPLDERVAVLHAKEGPVGGHQGGELVEVAVPTVAAEAIVPGQPQQLPIVLPSDV